MEEEKDNKESGYWEKHVLGKAAKQFANNAREGKREVDKWSNAMKAMGRAGALSQQARDMFYDKKGELRIELTKEQQERAEKWNNDAIEEINRCIIDFPQQSGALIVLRAKLMEQQQKIHVLMGKEDANIIQS